MMISADRFRLPAHRMQRRSARNPYRTTGRICAFRTSIESGELISSSRVPISRAEPGFASDDVFYCSAAFVEQFFDKSVRLASEPLRW